MPAFLAAVLMLASPKATTPRYEVTLPVPILLEPELLVAPSGPLTSVHQIPVTGLFTVAQPVKMISAARPTVAEVIHLRIQFLSRCATGSIRQNP
jgi:hypothetical protein